jgi:hypothetical protein
MSVEQAGPRRRRPWASIALACLLLASVCGAAAWYVARSPAPSADAGPGVAQSIPSPAPTSTGPTTAAPSPDPSGTTAAPTPTVGRAPATVPVAAADPPAALAFPALDVQADVVPVGVRDDGSMEIPRDGATVGWYRWGPEPGDAAGSAVLSGHVSTRAGGPGALVRLAEVAPGDTLEVTTTGGSVLTYRVVGVETITKSVLPVDRIFARDVPHRLTVITCGGPFQPELGSYRDNVVVVAEPVDPPAGG